MLVTLLGCKGMLGESFLKYFKQNQIECIAFSHETCDITDPALEKKLPPSDLIINAAAYTHVDLAEEEEEKAHAINTKGPKNLGRCAKKSGAKLIHFSTDYVFNGKGASQKETDETKPLNVYGKSKLDGEKALLCENPHALIVRTSWLFGLTGKNFVSTMMHLMRERKELRVVSDQRGRPTFCDDLVKAALHLKERSGIFHFANRGAVSWYEFALSIQELIQENDCKIFPISSDEYPQRAQRPSYSVLNTDRFESVCYSIRHYKEALKDYLCQKEHLAAY